MGRFHLAEIEISEGTSQVKSCKKLHKETE